ncbi:4-hydroxy-tetrahydrodipicolinate reductase [Phycicoccus endophyticus]|nr:4-hydroxy-tetrahydrodipicolinate reductase [Phycicoccus endophyticus]
MAVVGAGGRMGRAACAAVEAADDLELVGRFGRTDELGDLAGADVAVELTVPDASPATVAHCVGRGVHVVVGTSGWDEERLGRLRDQLEEAPGVGVLVAPNFAVGAVLMMELARRAAPFFESVEILEMHHPDKVDAPSGTAARTAELVAEARSHAGVPPAPDATARDPDGARGARLHGVPVHSVRLRGLVAHQEVLLGNPGEVLTLRHDSLERSSFMTGVLTGVRRVAEHPGLTVGLEHYLGLDA